jgi:hypothetical protein
MGLLSMPAAADIISGNDILALHRATEPQRSPTAFYYMRGVMDSEIKYRLLYTAVPKGAAMDFLEPKWYCAPDTVQYGQIYDVFILQLAKDPANRHLAAGHLLGVALQQAWPCPPAAK